MFDKDSLNDGEEKEIADISALGLDYEKLKIEQFALAVKHKEQEGRV